MALDGDFLFAYGAFAVLFVWATFYWITSDFLRKRYRRWIRFRDSSNPATRWKVIFELFGTCLVGILLLAVLSGVLEYLTFQKQIEKELQSLDGKLFPGNAPDPSSVCSIAGYPSLTVFFPTGLAVTSGKFPFNVVSGQTGQIDEPIIVADRNDDGSINLSMDIRDIDGKIELRLDRNGYYVNPNAILRMIRRDRNSISIIDQYGNETIQARFINNHAFTLSGKFMWHGRILDLSKIPVGNGCLSLDNGTSSDTAALHFHDP
jgi:hypothetical protein